MPTNPILQPEPFNSALTGCQGHHRATFYDAVDPVC